MSNFNNTLISSIKIDDQNLEKIISTGKINGLLLREIKRILTYKDNEFEYNRQSEKDKESLEFIDKCAIATIQGISESTGSLIMSNSNLPYEIIAKQAYKVAVEMNKARIRLKNEF